MTITRYYTGPLDSVTIVDTDLETETVVRRGDPLECSEELAARLDAQNSDDQTHWAKTSRNSDVKTARAIPRPLNDITVEDTADDDDSDELTTDVTTDPQEA